MDATVLPKCVARTNARDRPVIWRDLSSRLRNLTVVHDDLIMAYEFNCVTSNRPLLSQSIQSLPCG